MGWFEVREMIRRLIQRAGYDVHKYSPTLQFALRRNKISVLLDVGANAGQAARMMRKAGYRGRIFSFEPLSSVHPKLMATAKSDPLWTVEPRCAVGSSPGVVQLHIAGNSESSSILTMLDRHVTAIPQAAFIGTEDVTKITLDRFLDGHPELADAAIALKMDTQGYEAEVLAGLERWSGNVKVIHTEMSLTALYEGELRFIDMFQLLESRGYRCIRIEPAWADPTTFEIPQVDAIFER